MKATQPAGNGLTLGGSGGSGLKLSASAVNAFMSRPDMQLGGGSTQSVESTYYPQPGSPDFMGPPAPMTSSVGVPLTEAQQGAMALGFGPRNAQSAQLISDTVGRLISPEDLQQLHLQPTGAGGAVTGGRRPTLLEVLEYAQTYPALEKQIREMGDAVKWGMNPDDAVRALLNSPRATSTLKSDYETPLKTSASMSAWDGVDRKAQAQASLNKNLSEAVLLPVAATIPVLQTTRLAAYGLGTVYSTVGWKGTAALSGSITVAMDAGTQYAITGEVRPVQTAFAGLVGTVSGPLAATGSLFTNVVLGGAGAALNTEFQNSYYGEDKNLFVPVLVGSTFGFLGFKSGAFTTQATSSFKPEISYTSFNPKVPALFQAPFSVQPVSINYWPQILGVTSGGVISGLSPLGEGAVDKFLNPTPRKP